MTIPRRSSAIVLILAPILLIVLTGCQLNNPPQPTVIPTDIATLTSTPEPTASLGPTITLRPIIEATQAPATAAPVAEVPTQVPTPGAYCRIAKANDTMCGLIFESAYPVCSPELSDAFRAANNMSAGSTNIQPGQQYCVPRPTPTITPTHFDETETAVADLVMTLHLGGPGLIATYIVKSTDNITTIELNTGVSLRIICDMNGPVPLNCAGCDLDKPVNEHGCHPTVVVGESLKIPGPTPTPSITPTLTGSETATPTPPYGAPVIVSPINGAAETGSLQLVWLPVGTILQADQFYLVLISEANTNNTWEFESQATSLRLPSDIEPSDGSQHTFNWRVVVSTKDQKGNYVVIGEKSLISTFTWK